MPIFIPEFLSARLARPVAIFGGGVSGEGARTLLARLGAATATYDQRGEAFTAAAAGRHGLVVFSPGFPRLHPWLEEARKGGAICLGELDFASLFWNGRIIAITGTNGKTTLTEFLTYALNRAGIQAYAAGNIGYPLGRLVAELDGGAAGSTAVCEVSSFQAEQMGHFRAAALLWTNFAEDHLERHGSMEGYFAAKWELLARVPADKVFVGSSVSRYAAGLNRALPPHSEVDTEAQAPDPGLEGTPFAAYPQRENFILAAAWWAAEGLPRASLYEAARDFKVGRHRLAPVATVDGITYWNDSKATNFHAVEAALAGFDRPVVLIAGGRAKGGDLAAFALRIAPRVAHAVLIGETGPALAAALAAAGCPVTLAPGLEEAVRIAAAHAAGGVVLLSPGFASFDMYRNYEDRGERFERAVHDLQTAPSLG